MEILIHWVWLSNWQILLPLKINKFVAPVISSVSLGVASHVMRLKIGCMWGMNAWNKLIFCVLIQIQKNYWVGIVQSGCGQFGHGTLKLAVSQNLTDGMNWFFACWCKFRKAKSWFNHFWVGLVKNGSGFEVYETLKSAVS